MEAALSPSAVITPARPRGLVIAYWAFTVLFCLQIGFTAYAQLSLAQLEEVFRHVGMPSWFRVELAWAKFLGIAVLLLPAPARLKEWAHAGFVITLVSAIIAHIASNEGPEVWSWAAGTLVLWALSYFFWRKTERR